MVSRADRIFVGECLERRVHESENGRGVFTEYTFHVLRALKGVRGPTVTFRVASTPDGRGFLDLPVFDLGERTLLLLYPSGAGGKTSPLGLDQGRFRIVQGSDGALRAVNGRGNLGLFRDVSPAALERQRLVRPEGGPVRLGELEALIRSLVASGEP
jgi:hypothetical protein